MIRSVGIDLGTSNTLVYQFGFAAGTTYDPPSSIRIFYEDECGFPSLSGDWKFPSVLYLKETGEEIRPYVGAVAEILIANNPGCSEARLFNTKRLMGNSDELKLAHGYTAEKVAEEFYRCCGNSLMHSQYFRTKRQWNQIQHICITRPAAFDPYGVNETINAATKAMCEIANAVTKDALPAPVPKIEVLKEPQAALLTFLYECLNDPEAEDELLRRQNKRDGILRVAVVDIGGGTTDVSVQMLSVSGDHGDKTEEDDYIAGSEYATNYVIQFINSEMKDGSRSHFNPLRHFGGLDFDAEAAKHLIERLDEQCRTNGFDIYALSDDEKMHIRNIAMMEAKSFKDSPQVVNGAWMPKLDFVGYDRTVIVSYRQEEYDAWVSDLIGSSRRPHRLDQYNKPCPTIYSIIADTLRNANLQPSDLDYMYVTGGMSLYPPVYRMLQEEFGAQTKMVRSSVNALNDIAMGASLFNTYFQVKQDVSNLEENLMLDLPEGEPVILAQAGKPLPQEKTIEFPLANPVEIALDILMGPDPLSPDLHKIKMLRAQIPMTRIGTPVELRFKIPREQSIHIALCVKSEVEPFEIPIDTSFGQNIAGV